MRLFGITLLTLLLAATSYAVLDIHLDKNTFSLSFGDIFKKIEFFENENEEVNQRQNILFVGDLMLGRSVERIMNEYGSDYPYRHLAKIFASHTYQVANFEGSVPKEHQPTKDLTYRFSFNPSHLGEFVQASFTHASLANNHSFDFGKLGYENTISVLDELGVDTFGFPYGVGTSSIEKFFLNQKPISIVGIDLTLDTPSKTDLENTFRSAKENDEFLVVFVHWGIEYSPTHSQNQEKYAKQFVDLGADLIIGHHPHVVQDIQIYKDSLIFYSLGNFVFDQYFSDDVQIGLMISLDFDEKLNLKLMPVSSIGSRMSPRLMSEFESDQFLKDLAKKSDKSLYDQILLGEILR